MPRSTQPIIIQEAMQQAIPFSLPLSELGVNATLVYAGKCGVFSYEGSNTSTRTVYLKFYDLGREPNVGVDEPVWTVFVEAQAKFQNPPTIAPVKMQNGLAFAITALAMDDDDTPISQGEISGFNIAYSPIS